MRLSNHPNPPRLLQREKGDEVVEMSISKDDLSKITTTADNTIESLTSNYKTSETTMPKDDVVRTSASNGR